MLTEYKNCFGQRATHGVLDQNQCPSVSRLRRSSAIADHNSFGDGFRGLRALSVSKLPDGNSVRKRGEMESLDLNVGRGFYSRYAGSGQ